MPGDKVFVDTNALLYLHDRRFPEKRARMVSWLDVLSGRRAVTTNLQVLNELTNVLLRKNWFDSTATVFAVIDEFALFGATPIASDTTRAARILFSRYRYSWWDCLLLASALELGCTHFLSEDLQDGQAIEAASDAKPGAKSLTIVDPFAHSPDQIRLSR